MKIKNVPSLSDFLKSYRQDFPKPTSGKEYYSDLLFRGQGNSKFKLETTLERYTKQQFSFYDYLQRLDLCHDEEGLAQHLAFKNLKQLDL